MNQKIKVYVAGASIQIDRAKAFIAKVREMAHLELTFDWPAFVEEHQGGGSNDANVPESVLIEGALSDLSGVDDADVVVFLVPPPQIVSKGACGEYTRALLHKLTIVVGPTDRPAIERGAGIFGVLASVWVSHDADALNFLREEGSLRLATAVTSPQPADDFPKLQSTRLGPLMQDPDAVGVVSIDTPSGGRASLTVAPTPSGNVRLGVLLTPKNGTASETSMVMTMPQARVAAQQLLNWLDG